MNSRSSSYCRSVKGPSAMYTVLIHLLIVSVVSGAARIFNDEPCKPRPEVVPLSNDHSLKPYHIILHRCKGTCDISASPKSKPCAVGSEQDVVVKGYAVDGSYKEVTLKNHTSCLCNCDAKCDWNKETLDETNCRCVSYGTPVTGSRKDPCEEKTKPLPFIIGMALVGFFALCVLIFDAMLCAKGMGVMHNIKKSCCSRGGESTINNGSPQSPNSPNMAEVTVL